MKKIYIASPYTVGDVAVNVKRQIDVASKLIDMGYAPFWPLHSHFLHMAHPKEYETWMEIDLDWLIDCDAVLRLPGESKGADREVVLAAEHNIPVCFKLEDLPDAE